MAAPSPSPIVSALPEEESRGSSSGRLPKDMADRFTRIMAEYAGKGRNQVRRESVDCYSLSRETEFCDVDDGSFRSCKARKVAVLASKSVVSLSSFSDGKRIRVCSGFVIGSDPGTNSIKILTSATLVRSLCARNILIPDVKVKVGLPDGHICDGLISMVDFHYNLAVVEVISNEKLPEAILAKKVIKRGAVLAIGRFYDHGGVMCAQGEIRKRASTFECSELLVSSCHTTMAGVGGPLVNHSGHVVGINFYGENHTPFLSTVVIVRCLDHWKSYGKIIRPWLGLIYTPIDVLPLRVLEKCSYVDNGFYISKLLDRWTLGYIEPNWPEDIRNYMRKYNHVEKRNYIANYYEGSHGRCLHPPRVAEGSPADVAGFCVGDVLVECAGEVLSTAPKMQITSSRQKESSRRYTLHIDSSASTSPVKKTHRIRAAAAASKPWNRSIPQADGKFPKLEPREASIQLHRRRRSRHEHLQSKGQPDPPQADLEGGTPRTATPEGRGHKEEGAAPPWTSTELHSQRGRTPPANTPPTKPPPPRRRQLKPYYYLHYLHTGIRRFPSLPPPKRPAEARNRTDPRRRGGSRGGVHKSPFSLREREGPVQGSVFLRSNLAVEVVVRKQSDGSTERKTMFADVLSESYYYRWVDPLPVYNEETNPRPCVLGYYCTYPGVQVGM